LRVRRRRQEHDRNEERGHDREKDRGQTRVTPRTRVRLEYNSTQGDHPATLGRTSTDIRH
jgi:hypothetical protein